MQNPCKKQDWQKANLQISVLIRENMYMCVCVHTK